MTELELENLELRNLLFSEHGNTGHYLYGDDGERWCNTCGINFIKDTIPQIQEKMFSRKLYELELQLQK